MTVISNFSILPDTEFCVNYSNFFASRKIYQECPDNGFSSKLFLEFSIFSKKVKKLNMICIPITYINRSCKTCTSKMIYVSLLQNMQVSRRENLPQFLNSWHLHTATDLTNLLICNSKIERFNKVICGK